MKSGKEYLYLVTSLSVAGCRVKESSLTHSHRQSL